MDWLNSLNDLDVNGNETMSFFDYFEIFKKHPEKELRPTSAYLQDMVNHFGRDEDGHLQVFAKDDQDAPAVFGQHKIEEKVIESLRNFAEEGFNNNLSNNALEKYKKQCLSSPLTSQKQRHHL